ncbi:hypothetical protein PoB_000481400 [Plakobranchus ocellatus]|uniref:Uncharacterized protein n=1 Tax=Plakobranchus ocellatus TaxID=259542 RepID=A0AAV3Y8B7_9GAST|nr:hypothetical protein PoB_000481400 [Plakobranchus ocellatus]
MQAFTKYATLVLVWSAFVSSANAFDAFNADQIKDLIPLGCEAFDTMHTLLDDDCDDGDDDNVDYDVDDDEMDGDDGEYYNDNHDDHKDEDDDDDNDNDYTNRVRLKSDIN